MDRTAGIGCGGPGKTYLANQLAALLHLPLIHLDAVYDDVGWNPLPAEEFATLQESGPRRVGSACLGLWALLAWRRRWVHALAQAVARLGEQAPA